jgi:hypothetical protein
MRLKKFLRKLRGGFRGCCAEGGEGRASFTRNEVLSWRGRAVAYFRNDQTESAQDAGRRWAGAPAMGQPLPYREVGLPASQRPNGAARAGDAGAKSKGNVPQPERPSLRAPIRLGGSAP